MRMHLNINTSLHVSVCSQNTHSLHVCVCTHRHTHTCKLLCVRTYVGTVHCIHTCVHAHRHTMRKRTRTHVQREEQAVHYASPPHSHSDKLWLASLRVGAALSPAHTWQHEALLNKCSTCDWAYGERLVRLGASTSVPAHLAQSLPWGTGRSQGKQQLNNAITKKKVKRHKQV